jgi:hypothetical protein
MENPRLMIALIAVTDAQMMNGRVIHPLGRAAFENPVLLLRQTTPVILLWQRQTIVTAKSEWRHNASCYWPRVEYGLL